MIVWLHFCTTLLALVAFSTCCYSAKPPHKLRLHAIFSQPNPPLSTPRPTPSADDFVEDIVRAAERLMSHHHDSQSALKKFRLAGIFGHSGALATAAALLLVGDSRLSRHIPSAVRYLQLAASNGQSDAQALLGVLHASGLADRHGIVKSHARAVLYWTFAAESGNIYASTALGFRHLHGVGVKKSCQLAARYYQHAAHSIATDSRNWPSALNFVNGKPPLPTGLVETPPTRLTDKSLAGEKNDAANQDVVHFYRHSADHGSAVARTTLGALYYFGGHGIEPDIVEARRHLDMAATATNGEAHTMLGHLDMRARQNQSAFEHFMYAVGYNNHNAHYALGMVYKYGLLGKQRDYSKAVMHFTLATDHNKHAGAYFQLGMLHHNGMGVDRNQKEAFRYFDLAAKEGNIQSKLNIGTMLIKRSHFNEKADCERGVELLKEVAEDGEWRTVFELAMERIDESDWYGALHRYTEAAYAGIELAQYNAAFLLERLRKTDFEELEHWDRKRMLDEAYELYELSALQGHTDSLIRSANVMYLEGKNYRLAANTFEKAAHLRNAEGMVSLGLMHAQGLGVEQSRERAVSYLEMASRADEEAVAPAKVALVGFQIYWMAEDVFNVLMGKFLPKVLYSGSASQGKSARLTRYEEEEAHDESVTMASTLQGAVNIRDTRFSLISGDMAVVGALLVALVAVLIVRTKRLARQNTGESGVVRERGRVRFR